MPVTFTQQELTDAVDRLPPVVSVMRRLLAVLRDPNSEVDDIARLIRADMSLTAQLLRLANSPHYGLSERVGSVEEAIQHVGINEVARLVSTLGGRRVFSRDLQAYRVPASLLWQHTLAVAVAAEQVAGRFVLDGSTLYLGGLLHTIGMVALDAIATARGVAPCPEGASLPQWEIEAFGIENSAVAERVLLDWNFPADLCAAIRSRYEKPTRATIARPGSALHIACAIAEKIPAGLPVESGLFRFTPEELHGIGLGEEGFGDLELSSLQLFSRVRAMLSLA